MNVGVAPITIAILVLLFRHDAVRLLYAGTLGSLRDRLHRRRPVPARPATRWRTRMSGLYDTDPEQQAALTQMRKAARPGPRTAGDRPPDEDSQSACPSAMSG
jgi:hypothetical protein